MRLLPDLHRADAVPQWETVPEAEWNEYQRRAAETNGWDTPGNRLSLEGAVETLAGLALISMDRKETTALGVGLVMLGRVRDLQDGKRAAETGTMSPMGEVVDAGLDTMLKLAAAMVLKRTGIMPKEAADERIANTAVKMTASSLGRLFGRETHTSRTGKYGTFADWGDIITRTGKKIAEQFGREDVSGSLEQPTALLTEVGLRMDRHATAGYVRNALFGR